MNDFQASFPDYDGMLNYNDGLRNDWPNLCTLTIYGSVYYKRFGYIYHPDYESVYCDQEQTLVGRLLNKIKDINRVIIKHDWTNPLFQDDLRRKTETQEQYAKDRTTFESRKQKHFDLSTVSTPPQTTSPLLTVFVVCNDIDSLSVCTKTLMTQLQQDNGITIQSHFCKNDMVFSFSYLHRLTFSVTTPFVTFHFPGEMCLSIYEQTVLNELETNRDTDVLTFCQECSLDGGQTTFIVESNVQYNNDSIPNTAPWKKAYHRNVCNWSIFRTSLWQTMPMNLSDDRLISTLVNSIKTHKALNTVLYKYTVN